MCSRKQFFLFKQSGGERDRQTKLIYVYIYMYIYVKNSVQFPRNPKWWWVNTFVLTFAFVNWTSLNVPSSFYEIYGISFSKETYQNSFHLELPPFKFKGNLLQKSICIWKDTIVVMFVVDEHLFQVLIHITSICEMIYLFLERFMLFIRLLLDQPPHHYHTIKVLIKMLSIIRDLSWFILSNFKLILPFIIQSWLFFFQIMYVCM